MQEQNIGKVIRNLRNKEKITASELAKKIGVSQGTISHIETGKRTPSDELLEKIQNELKIPEKVIQNATQKDNDVKSEKALIADTGITKAKIIILTKPSKKDDNMTHVDKLKFNIESDIVARTFFEFLENNRDKINKLISQNIKDAISALSERDEVQLSFSELDKD